MPAKQVYEYALIRYVPRVEREEFLNVGVALFSKRLRFLDVRIHLDEARILAFYPEADLEELRDYLDSWVSICRGEKGAGKIAELDAPERFRWLTATRSTIIQSSGVHPGMTDNPAGTLEQLFRKYVC
jgi:hypothetical protein